jgi:hypothetical protein
MNPPAVIDADEFRIDSRRCAATAAGRAVSGEKKMNPVKSLEKAAIIWSRYRATFARGLS